MYPDPQQVDTLVHRTQLELVNIFERSCLYSLPPMTTALTLIFQSLRGSDSSTPESCFTLVSPFVSLPTAGEQPGPFRAHCQALWPQPGAESQTTYDLGWEGGWSTMTYPHTAQVTILHRGHTQSNLHFTASLIKSQQNPRNSFQSKTSVQILAESSFSNIGMMSYISAFLVLKKNVANT